MISKHQKVVIADGVAYTLTGESYGPRRYTDSRRSYIPGKPNQAEWLHRAKGNVWIREQANISAKNRRIGISEFYHVSGEIAKRILMALQETGALLKYGLVKTYQDDSHDEKDSENDEIVSNEFPQQLSEKGLVKLRQVKGILVELAKRKHNDPEQKEILNDCIQELSAIENLASLSKLDSSWWLPIRKTLDRLFKFAKRIGEKLLIEEILKLRDLLQS